MQKRIIGIIGGMGPLATVDLFRKIVEQTNASCDQEHIHILIDNNTNIADRTTALIGGGASPLPELQKSAEFLEQGGAQCLVMPCNTAHGFYEDVQKSVSIPVLNMISLTCNELLQQGITCAGLLATSGTIQTGVYEKYFHDIELIYPSDEEQPFVMDMIYGGVKAGKRNYDSSVVQRIADHLLDRGAQCIILGCTELPLAMELYHLKFPSIDPTLVLAKGAIAFALGTKQPV